MKISEVVGDGLMSFVAVVRCAVEGMGSVTTRVAIRCDGVNQARHLLTRAYGRGNVLSIRLTVLEQSDRPAEPCESVIKPKSGIIKPIKPMSPKQGMKKAMADQKRAAKKAERKAKAIKRVRDAQLKLADINRMA